MAEDQLEKGKTMLEEVALRYAAGHGLRPLGVSRQIGDQRESKRDGFCGDELQVLGAPVYSMANRLMSSVGDEPFPKSCSFNMKSSRDSSSGILLRDIR